MLASSSYVAAPVSVEMRGITGGDDPYVTAEALDAITSALKRHVSRGASPADLRKIGRDTLINLLWERTKQRPMVIATILEV